MDLGTIREHSLSVIPSLGLKIPSHLPLLEGDTPTRSASDVVDRMLCMHIVCAIDAGLERKKGMEWLVSEGLYEQLTGEEAKFISRRHLRKSQRDIQVEAVFCLMWIVGLAANLDFRKRCPDDLVYSLPNPLTGDSGSEWRQKAKMRDTEELLLARDLAYCVHWAVVEAVFKGRTLRKIDMPSVPERRKALEWLFVSEDWDEVSLDT